MAKIKADGTEPSWGRPQGWDDKWETDYINWLGENSSTLDYAEEFMTYKTQGVQK
jgi:hypothetical protein